MKPRQRQRSARCDLPPTARPSLRWTILLSVAVLAGCSQARFEPQAGGMSDRVTPFKGEVTVLRDHPPPPFERLGVVIARGGGMTSDERLLDRLRDEAAARGANTLVLQSEKPLEQTTAEGHQVTRWAGFALHVPSRP
ncbi:MAG: hypothetical protein KDK91_16080 [Gammaproteobacteria bacterium]|nr:hypothetical protein [Gammaproteobacteria bacterium]